VAQAIHARSGRGAVLFWYQLRRLAPTLIESELFGFERGSFTGAARSHAGMVERASGGTLFLDEVTEMSADMQRGCCASSRRAASSASAVRRRSRPTYAWSPPPTVAGTGGARWQPARDLLYRLAVFPIMLAPLRERGEDVVLLAEHFLGEINARNGTAKVFSGSAKQTLCAYRWPGNVRELKNAVERAYIMSEHELQLQPMNLHTSGGDGEATHADAEGISVPIGSSLAEAEQWLIEATLAHWRVTKTARRRRWDAV